MSRIRSLAWPLMTLGTAFLVLQASEYFVFFPKVFFEPQHAVYKAYHFFLLMHIGGMIIASSMAPSQFLPGFRNRHLKLHRNMGKLYIVGSLIGGVGGAFMSLHSRSGFGSGSAFFLLAIVTLFTTTQAYLLIRQRRVQQHREWMIRSFSMLFAAVMLRVYYPVLRSFISDYDAFAIAAWLSWVPNLLFAEWLIRRSRTASRPIPASGALATES